MNKLSFALLVFFVSAALSCNGQKSFGEDQLTLKQNIVLSQVQGRIDHLDLNAKDQVIYMAALGNNSLEVIDIKNGKQLRPMQGLNEPQGVIYIPQTNEVLVANGGNGSCVFYNAATFQSTAKIDLGSDADDVRYDSVAKRIYVGYGEGGIAVIDALQHKKIADGKLPAHPEGFQLDRKLNRLFVNIPDAGKIVVFDLSDMKILAQWKTEFKANFPMAIDEKDHILFIGYRRPGKLVAINEINGQTIAATDLISDVDDLYFDERTGKAYASGGGGAIDIFSFKNNKFEQVARIPTKTGARTSLFIPSLNNFVLAERSVNGEPANLKVYTTKQ